MRRIVSAICLLLPLAVPALASAPQPQLQRYGLDGRLHPFAPPLLREYAVPAARDLAFGFGGDLLLLTPDGDLRRIAERDSLDRSFLSADIDPGQWPEALSADGSDWLLLIQGGRALLRLGRRGEAKEEIVLPAEGIWRGVRADRAGRIWLAEDFAGGFIVMSRSGQVMLQWQLSQRVPGYRGPVLAWCPDERGGLYVAEGWPARIHHLNAAGNALGSWETGLTRGRLALAVDGRDALLLAHGDETVDLHLAVRRNPDEIALGAGRRLWILAAGGPLDEAR